MSNGRSPALRVRACTERATKPYPASIRKTSSPGNVNLMVPLGGS